MISVSLSIDVPDLTEAVRFYEEAFGFAVASRPLPEIVVLHASNAEICLLEREAGSRPSSYTDDTRRYERHWTPVHLDLHVDDFEAALQRAQAAGATCEAVHDGAAHPGVAFCSDPWGHGFCLIEGRD